MINTILKNGLFRFLTIAIVMLCSVNAANAQCQTITAVINSTSPAASPVDTIIKICKNTTVTFNGTGIFSGSSTGATYNWDINNGATVLPGLTASYTFVNEGVYVVDFKIEDPAGCVNKNCDSRRIVQVSTTPHFDQTSFADTMCLGTENSILGVVTPIPAQYVCAPPVADTTFLPDGSGVSYTTSIDVTCFTPCDTVATANDILGICMNIEHSYLGDLDAKIICPNNQEANLFYTYNAGGGSTFLGEPNDPGPGNNIPGIGYTYCFRPTATWGPFVNMLTNTVPVTGMPPGTPGNAMIAGNYQPQQSYNSLIGCPLNGTWTIQITDHLGADNGFIFFWSIEFAKNVSGYSFTPTYPTQNWTANPDIIATSANGANVVVKPTVSGYRNYTYNVIDAFGCPYDTTISIYVVDPGDPGKDTTITVCSNQLPFNAIDYLAGTPDPGGVWSGSGVTPGGMVTPSSMGAGTHVITYTQSDWLCDTAAHITIELVNSVDIDFSYDFGFGCSSDTVHFTNLSEPGEYWWNFGIPGVPEDTTKNPTYIYYNQAVYTVQLKAKNLDGCVDSIFKMVDITHPLVAGIASNTDSVCQKGSVQFTSTTVGAATGWQWDFGDGQISTLQNPQHTYTLAGTHQVRLIVNDVIPCYDTSYTTIYVDSMPFFQIIPERRKFCVGELAVFNVEHLYTLQDIYWNLGDGAQWSDKNGTSHRYEIPGKYYVTGVASFPVCESIEFTDSIVVSAVPKVDLGADATICLDAPSITVTDIANANDPTVTWRWSTGATTSSIEIKHPGEYTVTVTKDDCATSEKITVNKDCYTDIPNAFSPNGDGVNDYFYPKNLLAKGVVGFTMTIFNRWGQMVFETKKADGRGWDGMFNDKVQPTGVYIYKIIAVMKNGKIEEYNGNVTLVR